MARLTIRERRFMIVALTLPMIVVITICYGVSIYAETVPDFFSVNFADLGVAYGTLVLAFFTGDLALTETIEARAHRNLMVDEAHRERERLWIKEKLDEFYGPLIGRLEVFAEGDRERTKETVIDPIMDRFFIRDKYQLLASGKLQGLLDRYFSMTSVDIRKDKMDSTGLWKSLMDEIKDTIQDDFKELKHNYYKLIGSNRS